MDVFLGKDADAVVAVYTEDSGIAVGLHAVICESNFVTLRYEQVIVSASPAERSKGAYLSKAHFQPINKAWFYIYDCWLEMKRGTNERPLLPMRYISRIGTTTEIYARDRMSLLSLRYKIYNLTNLFSSINTVVAIQVKEKGTFELIIQSPASITLFLADQLAAVLGDEVAL